MEKNNLFSKKEKNAFLKGIYSKIIDKDNLDKSMYEKTAKHILKGVEKGFKEGINVKYNTPDIEMLKSLKENVYIFSAAKTYHQTKDISNMLLNEKGEKITFDEFNEKVSQTFDTYNESYLESEYNTAISSSRNASDWVTFEKNKDIYSQLQYQTIIDDSTSEECEELDGFTANKDDSVWDNISPPNHFNCRCLLIEVDGEIESSKEEIPELDEEFQQNSGKSGEIFNSEHPFFQVTKEDRELAENNFNLPMPENE